MAHYLLRRTGLSLLLLLTLLLAACSGPDEMVGKWRIEAVYPDESKGPAPQMVKDLLGYLRGAEYVLRADGTFHKKGSFEDISGKWTREGDLYTLTKANETGDKELWEVRKREKAGYEVVLKSQSPDYPDMLMRIKRIGEAE